MPPTHIDILEVVGRQNPYAAARIGRASRDGRAGAARIAKAAAEAALGVGRTWRTDARSGMLAWRKFAREAYDLYDKPWSQAVETAAKWARWQVTRGDVSQKEFTKTLGRPRLGWFELRVYPRYSGNPYFHVNLRTNQDPMDPVDGLYFYPSAPRRPGIPIAGMDLKVKADFRDPAWGREVQAAVIRDLRAIARRKRRRAA